MGATTFDRWLGTPSTICFLRRLLAATGETNYGSATLLTPGSTGHARPYSTTAVRGCKRYQARFRKVVPAVDGYAAPGRTAPKDAKRIASPTEDVAERATRALWVHVDVAARRTHAQSVQGQKEGGQDVQSWIETLERRQRLDGFAGLHDVWKGMRYRGIDLPVKGPQADILWPILINACISPKFIEDHDVLRDSIWQHAKDLYARSGSLYPHLYRLIIGRAIRYKPKQFSIKWHQEFLRDFGASNIDLRLLALDFASTLHAPDAFRNFSAVYKLSDQRNLYDSFMSALLLTGDERFALRWHRIFMKHGDGPSAEMFATAGVQRMFRLAEDRSLPMVHRKPSDVSSMLARGVQFPALTRATMSTMVGEAHGIKPKEVSDNFVAKLFATNAFSLDMVLRGLSFFSIESLGPLALHELAIRAESRDEMKQILSNLKTLGIEVGHSVYGKVLQKVVHDGPDELFDVLLANDQHPEAYDDLKVQARLLHVFLAEGNLSRAHLALTALASGGAPSNVAAWNVTLQHYIQTGQYQSVISTYQQMQLVGVTVTNHSLVLIRRHLLPPRDRGRGPSHVEPLETENKRPLQFMTNVSIYAAQHGTPVYPSIWIELLKRYGMMNRWDELEHLVRTLVPWYSSKWKRLGWYSLKWKRIAKQRHEVEPHQLNHIFKGQMLKAIVAWGFKNAAERRLLSNKGIGAAHGHCETWAQGVMLLKQLSAHGLRIAPETVRDALLTRLWILFGPAFSSKASNEQYRLENELTLAHYIRHANEVWDGALFPVRPELLQNIPGNSAKLMLTIFGPIRRVSLRRKEVADVSTGDVDTIATVREERVLGNTARSD